MTIEVGLTASQDINGILWGWKWGDGPRPEALILTYSFPTTAAEYTANGYVQIDNFTPFTPAQQTAVTNILANAASFSNLTFTLTVAANAVLRYANATQVDYGGPTDLIFHALHAIPTAEANPPELGFGGNPPASAIYAQGDSWYGITIPPAPGTPTLNYGNPLLGSFQYAAGIMHETGHNFGLKHGHVTQMGHGVNFPTLPADHNSYEYSVMTYSQFPGDQPGAPLGDIDGDGNPDFNIDNAPDHPTTFMQDDIQAIQWLYGANYGATANNTDTTYEWSTVTGEWFINDVGQGVPNNGNPSSDNFVLMTLWDGGGTDTYDLSNYTTNLSVDLNPGQWVVLDTSPAATAAQRADLGNDQLGGAEYFARGNIANALTDPNNPTETASLIENANGGSGNDTLIGNSIGNRFDGNGGNDTIDGRDGNDTAVYSGAKANYTTSLIAGSIQVADNRAGTPDGTDTNTNIEFFRFSDGTYTAAEVLNQPPVLSVDTTGPHFLDELLDTTNSLDLDLVSGTLAFTDPDSGDTHTASQALFSATWSGGATIPAATLTALATAMSAAIDVESTTGTGTLGWDFSLVDMLADFIALNETVTAVYNVTVTDHFGSSGTLSSGSSTQQVTIVIRGANDDPIAIPDSNGTAKGTTLTAGGLLANATDPDINDQDDLSIVAQTFTGLYGSLTIDTDGSYTYVANNGPLPSKIVAQDVFQYTLTDDNGGTDTANLYIVVFNPGASYQKGVDTILTGGDGPDVLDGYAGGCTLIGGNGPDVLIGGNGNVLNGGSQPDTYLFRPDFGTNTIVDLNVKADFIQFDKSIFTSIADILFHTSDNAAGNAVINTGFGDTVELLGVHKADLKESVFLLA